MLFLPEVETKFLDIDIPDDIDLGSETHLDIETSGLYCDVDDLWVINIGYSPDNCGNFTKALVCRVPDEKECPKNIKKYLENEKITKIIHNAIFDAPFIYKKWGVMTKNVLCTKILARIVRRCKSNSYFHLTKDCTGVILTKGSISVSPWNKPFSEWSIEMKKYCAYDVVFGKRIYDWLISLSTEEDRETFKRIMNTWDKIVEVQNNLRLGDMRHLS